MDKTIERPDYVTDEMLEDLDELRKRAVDIGEAQAYLRRVYGLDHDTASAVALYWIRTFTARHAA